MNAEQQILGACLSNKPALDTALSILTVEDFTGINKSVFEAIMETKASGKEVSSITVNSILNNLEYLLALTDYVVSIRTIKSDCYELKEISKKKRLEIDLSNLLQKSEELPLNELMKELNRITRDADCHRPDHIRHLGKTPYKGLCLLNGRYISTGLSKIDHALNDLMPGCVTLITGRANSGKSTLVNQIVVNAIDTQNKVLMVSGEGIQEIMINRLYQLIIGREKSLYELKKINKRLYKEPTIEVLKQLSKWHHDKLAIFTKSDSKLKTTDELFDLISNEIRSSGHNLVVIDNLMSILSVEKASEKLERQADFMQRCCDLAKEKMVHIILVLHPNKQVQKGMRMDFDQISGTQDLSNKADNIIAITRYYDEDELSKDFSGEIEVLKNRYHSELPTIKIHFDVETGFLLEYDEDRNEFLSYNINWKSASA
jgi:replicative DNA helicase